jgi:translation initiation factor IF-3
MQRVNRAKEFLSENNKVKFNLKFKRFEQNNPTFAFNTLNKVLSLLSDIGKPEEEPKIMGRSIIVVVLKK